MSIQADIDAKVAAFVSDLADLVRVIAIQSAREVLETRSGPGEAPRPRPAGKPRPKPTTHRSAPALAHGSVPAPAAPPAPAPRSLKDPRRGRLITVPSAPPPPLEPPMPVVVKVPAKMPRKARTPKAISVAPPPPVAAAEPQPARNWVVVRRPARERPEGALGSGSDASPLPGAAAPEANGAAASARPETV